MRTGAVLAAIFFAALTPAASAAQPTAAEALHALFDDEWGNRLRENPLMASRSGVHDYNDRLPSVSPADHQRRLTADKAFLVRLHAIDRAALTADDQLNHDLFAHVVGDRIEGAGFRPWRIPFVSDSGFHTHVLRMADGLAMTTGQDYRDYIARLRAIPAFFDQNIANMRLGLADGFTMPRAILDGVTPTIASQIVDDAEASPLFEPFTRMPATLAEDEREQLVAAGRAAIAEAVLPAYKRLHQFFVTEYVPGARQSLGAHDLPDGEAYYRREVRSYTTLDMKPADIHALGLAEVKRIRSEMAAIIEQVGFDGSFAEFLQFLRTDQRFYVTDPEQLLKEAAWIAKQVDGQMPAFFGKLPRLPYGVRPVPADIAPNYTTGRYWGAPVGGMRGGYYMVNTHAVEQRPLYVLPALTLHEAVPGHHHQISLAQEIENVPAFRRAIYLSAFGEGWGLYSEKLGLEMGLYDTPYKDFGRLTYEMWRACRLVVDTGIHAFGWTAEQARRFMTENTALALHNIRTEVDRYISWPGQALAYKMGELKILELRERATAALGAKFDIRQFHDAVLENGAVPLTILEGRIEAYIKATLSAKGRGY
ncbi:MAG: DUF885 family protein [Sphingomonadales bacterium]